VGRGKIEFSETTKGNSNAAGWSLSSLFEASWKIPAAFMYFEMEFTRNPSSLCEEKHLKLTLGMGNIEPNMATERPAVAPMATIARHFVAPT
jgi:hypothetical protein